MEGKQPHNPEREKNSGMRIERDPGLERKKIGLAATWLLGRNYLGVGCFSTALNQKKPFNQGLS